jgi:hypothetical protein
VTLLTNESGGAVDDDLGLEHAGFLMPDSQLAVLESLP